MPAHILDGRGLAEQHLVRIRAEVEARRQRGRRAPALAVILVGNDPASAVYVRNKRNAAERAGIRALDFDLPADVAAADLLALVDRLNADRDIDGILVQLPMPPHIDPAELIQRIDPAKDVDGFHAQNMGLLVLRQPGLRPCTPKGVIHLLRHAGAPFYGQHAVVVGASNHVGRPMVLELLLAGATVTCCHRFTQDLRRHVGEADLLVVAVGRPGIVRGEWIRPGAIVIDVGINRLADGTLAGDVDYEVAAQRAAWITPVPGGVGPMTVAMLMQNTLEAANATANCHAVQTTANNC
ncbi:MAG: bifunctional methylenetetrahydrofolate dehydrogenase/methenyltetrahydrofolate cyclohydrolase FolD [Xanthomonadales bacterium]|nr:bifunctional methylenetetrahydrofolate dehydrogenase/methenyltetrahydrofolate cyclohydrolase FolD [Xanthomonadales bacterium]